MRRSIFCIGRGSGIPGKACGWGRNGSEASWPALNNLLRSGSSDAFSLTVGDLGRLASVRYVITLDADTRLPPGVGQELVGCMAHPLNWPEIDPATRTVVQGHADPSAARWRNDPRRGPQRL